MARDPLEGVRPPDPPGRSGLGFDRAARSGQGARPVVVIAALVFGVICAITAAILVFAAQPAAQSAPAQSDVPAPTATLTPLAPPTATPTLQPPPPAPPPPTAASHDG